MFDARADRWLFAICMALLLAVQAAIITGFVPDDVESGVAIAVHPHGGAEGADGILLLPGGNRRHASADLVFVLPPTGRDDPRWVVWLARDTVESIELRRGDGWTSGRHSPFMPDREEGLLPSGYLFPLPSDWVGEVRLELHVEGSLRAAFAPRLLREPQARRMEQYGSTVAAMLYATLLTLALTSLALFSASRDRLFLAFFPYALVALWMLATMNGHLYVAPGFRHFAFWRSHGVIATIFVFSLAWLRIMLLYAQLAPGGHLARRTIDGVSLVLALLALLVLCRLDALMPWMQLFAVAAWGLAGVISLSLLVGAARRGVSMAWPLVVLVVLTISSAVAMEMLAHGLRIDAFITRYAYQIGLTLSSTFLAVGLSSRIGEYRDQRDRDRAARLDTERRMQREAMRSNLAAELQAQLRPLGPDELVWRGFHLLLEHLSPLVPTETRAVVLDGYRGRSLLLVEPPVKKGMLDEWVARRQLEFRRQCANGIPQQQTFKQEQAPMVVGMEAVVPLKIRSPAWGMLLLRRTGTEGFAPDELALAGEMARLTMLHVEQAMAELELRRSSELDVLTGCYNRRTIDQWLERSFADAQREGWPVSVLFIDLDHFKSVNDTLGHACGDYCLRSVAAALQGALPEGDLLGRYGGEEFIAILPARDGAAARATGERMRIAVENLELEWNGQPLRITVSLGVATRREDELAPMGTLERADQALYSAKRGGRNCVQVAPAVFG